MCSFRRNRVRSVAPSSWPTDEAISSTLAFVTRSRWTARSTPQVLVDTFDEETGRKAHLEGRIAKALMGKADELLASPPICGWPTCSR